jgi:methionyl-tRNA formyltransferase
MRIVAMGSGTLGLPAVERLHGVHEVALVVTQPDRPAGRKRKLTATPIAEWAEAHHVPTIKPAKCDDATYHAIRDAKVDVMFVAAFGQYLPSRFTSLPRLGEMNLHPSLLPKYRGAAPVNWAMINGEARTGNSLIRMAKQMDTGDVLAQRDCEIDPSETAGELHDRLAGLAPDLVLETIAGLDAGRITPVPQTDEGSTMAPKLSRDDAWVDFAADATAVRCRVHGLNPWPGVTTWWSAPGDPARHELKLRRVRDLPDRRHDAAPGTLIGDGVVAAGRGAVQLLEVQPPGKRTMAWADYQLGHETPVGSAFGRAPQG